MNNIPTFLQPLQDYIDDMNSKESSFKLADATHFWEAYEIETVDQFKEYLDFECFVNVYKDVNGFKPRGYTIEQARAWLEREAG